MTTGRVQPRVLVIVAALAAVLTGIETVLVAIDFVAFFEVRHIPTMGFSSVAPIAVGAILTGAIATPFALALLWRASHRAEARVLALFVALLPMFFNSVLLTTVFGGMLPKGIHAFDILTFLSQAGVWFGVAAFLRFTVLFPQPLQIEDLGRPSPGAASPWELSGQRRFVGALVRRMPTLAPFIETDIAAAFKRAFRRVVIHPAGVWLLALLGCAATEVMMEVSGLGGPAGVLGAVLWIVLPLTFMGLVVDGLEILRRGFALSSPHDRRRIAWVIQGVTASVATLVVAVTLLFVVMTGLLDGLEGAVAEWVGTSAFALPPLVLVVSLVVAIVYKGGLDPAMTIRATAVYGVVSVLLVFLFSATQSLFTTYVTTSTGVAGGAGYWLAGGVVAVALRPIGALARSRMEGFLDRTLPASTLATSPAEFASVMFSDLVGYSARTATDQADALTLVAVFHRVARRVAHEHDGALVKTIGDAVLLEFPNAAGSVGAALDLESSLRQACLALGLEAVALRTGLHEGDLFRSRDRDLYGDVVNVAARLQTLAEPGEVIVSASIAVAGASAGVGFEPMGSRTLKNMPEPVACFRCTRRSEPVASPG